MKPPEEPHPAKEAPKPKPSRSEVARWVVEDYMNDLREIIRKLRQRLPDGASDTDSDNLA
jgi:hypothetical protein